MAQTTRITTGRDIAQMKNQIPHPTCNRSLPPGSVPRRFGAAALFGSLGATGFFLYGSGSSLAEESQQEIKVYARSHDRQDAMSPILALVPERGMRLVCITLVIMI